MTNSLFWKYLHVFLFPDDSISRVQHDLEELRLRCSQLDSSLTTSGAELQHLRETNQRVQNDMRKALDTVCV